LKVYSFIIYDLFLWNLYFYSLKDFTTFTLSNFCETIKILEVPNIEDQCRNSFDNLKKRVLNKINEFHTNFPDFIEKINDFSIKLKEEKDLNPENAYLFIQGHTLFDNVVLMILKSVCNVLRIEHEAKIKTLSKHNQDLETNMNYYHNQLKKNNIEFLLANNNDYEDCFLFDKLKLDIIQYLDKLKSA